MTDLAMRTDKAISPPALSVLCPFALYTGLVAAGTAGLCAGASFPIGSDAIEPTLSLLLRFMAALKLAGVVVAALLVHWRMRRPIGPGLASAYIASVTTMALAPGLIWSLAHIGLAAALFHAGLLLFLILAFNDADALPRRAS